MIGISRSQAPSAQSPAPSDAERRARLRTRTNGGMQTDHKNGASEVKSGVNSDLQACRGRPEAQWPRQAARPHATPSRAVSYPIFGLRHGAACVVGHRRRLRQHIRRFNHGHAGLTRAPRRRGDTPVGQSERQLSAIEAIAAACPFSAARIVIRSPRPPAQSGRTASRGRLLRGFEIDDQLEPCRLLHRYFRRQFAIERLFDQPG